MINGFDSYKLSINNLNDINADTIVSNTDKTTSLYINGQLIDFNSYITSSYLSTTLTNYVTSSFLTSTLSSYVLASNLSSQLSNYVLSSTLSSTLSNYATISYVNSQLSNYASNGALSSYRLISDSYAKWEIDNMVSGLSAGIAANGAATTGVIASLTVTNATVAGIGANVTTLNGQVATINGDLTTINGQITTLQGKTQNITATAGVSNFTGSVNATTVSCTNVEVSTGGHTLNIGNNLYGGILTDNINIGTGLAFNNVNILGVLYINGVPFVPFNVSAPMTQWT
jgi:hypothetical protein